MKNLQSHFLLKALDEANIKYSSYRVNHKTGIDFVDGKPLSLIFPKSMLDLCISKWTDRSIEYYFKGTLTPKRNWCRFYTDLGIIQDSNRGRDDSVKYTYDTEYYTALGKTKFALCPTGDCPWSYRFFEAIMCGAIPILGQTDIDVLSDGFKFYRHLDTKEYRTDWVNHNLKVLQERNILCTHNTEKKK